jgi:signal transduction histidine kinase
VLKRAVERRQAENRRGKVVLPRDFSDQHHMVVIGEAEFLRVVDVLIDWAFAQGDGELSFDVKTSQDRWMLEMRHNGFSLPSDRWHRVFTNDTGLASDALSAVPEILSKYDGDICVKASSEDSGTTLLVRLRLMHA